LEHDTTMPHQRWSPFSDLAFFFTSSTIGATLLASNVTNLVTVRLTTPEDFLTRHIQFTAILVFYGLRCFVDSSYPLLASMIPSSSGESIPNPDFYNWMRYDQSIRSWIFATLSSEILLMYVDAQLPFIYESD